LPGDPDTLRGYSAPKLIIKDEAAYVSDAMQAALDPMLAVSKGRLIEMSSPNGKRGHFYENWQHGVDVERIKIIGRECPRIGSEFLDKMRQKLGPLLFAQEFEGEFIDAESSAFSFEMIELALVNAPETLIRELKQQRIDLPAPARGFQSRQAGSAGPRPLSGKITTYCGASEGWSLLSR
jgi:hypothetical protein